MEKLNGKKKLRVSVFISGRGTNLKSLINFSKNKKSPIKIGLIITNNKNAKGIIYAKKNSIPYMILNTKLRSNDNHILKTLEEKKISIICLAGYMKIISKARKRKWYSEELFVRCNILHIKTFDV